MPTPIEVKGSHLWKEKDMTKIQDLKTLEKTFDWSFSTPYKGTLNKFSSLSKFINSNEVQLDTILKPNELKEKDQNEHKIALDHKSEFPIPLEMLGQDNPILHYGEVVLFEDELGDKGFSRVNVRFRVMNNCFFVLLRSYTRVDHVLVRILDTRIFCLLDTDSSKPIELIRDF